jgi:lipid-binding SYLF domain-containing protein
MKLRFLSIFPIIALFAVAAKFDEHTKRIEASATVLSEIMAAGDHSIPRDLLEKAECVGIVPSLKRAGFIVGGKYGKGVLTCRVDGGNGWSAVSTIRIEGGSIGLQIGAGETDVIFIVMNDSGMKNLMRDKFTIGGDASAMAGPVGRSVEAQTDLMMRAEILSYSRAHGVFAGVSLDGATLRPDNDDNRKVYNSSATQEEILTGKVERPVSAEKLYRELNTYAPYKKASN